MTHKERITEYFSEIATRYDLVNHVLSFHCDRLWRRRLVRLAEFEPGMCLMDLCTGTGDLLLAAHRVCPNGELSGLDLTQPMLDLAAKKLARRGMAADLPASARVITDDQERADVLFRILTDGWGNPIPKAEHILPRWVDSSPLIEFTLT